MTVPHLDLSSCGEESSYGRSLSIDWRCSASVRSERIAGPWWRRAIPVLFLAVGAGAACAPTADDGKLPPDVQDPTSLHTPAGALELYRSSLLLLPDAFDEVMVKSAVLTDELMASPTPFGVAGAYTGLDSRQNPAGAGDVAYKSLHQLRAQVREARGFLAAYATDTAIAREQRGHLYAVEGYADVLLADLFCSGIPLSTVDFQGDYTVTPGLPTREVYRRAVGLFDSALALIRDSTAFQRLAAVGKGRALLSIGVYDSAALAVAAVPTDFRYRVAAPGGNGSLTWSMWSFANGGPGGGSNPASGYQYVPGMPSVGQHEGQNGLDYRSSDDRRAGGVLMGPDFYHHDFYFPTKYFPVNPIVQLTVADGIEARLIEAEAALQAGDAEAGLAALNALRTSGGVSVPDTIADTLGVTGCTPTAWCGGDNGPPSDDPAAGQPVGGFVLPAGYSYTGSYAIDPVSSALRDYCYNYSWYTPCWDGHTTVDVYVGPARTRWEVGSGGVPGLAALEDPGTLAARVDLLFKERAFWLYLTAHREGDLRRLVRQYGRNPEQIYPRGPYPGADGTYGDAILIPVPESERELNPQYSGCTHFGA